MYRDFYGLSERPFNLTPDTGFLYPSRVHREVLTHLLYGINARCGFILVTGEVGAGKTTLCRVLLSQLDERTKVAFVLNSFLSEFELLRAINQDFGLPTKGRTKMDLLDDLNDYLLEQNRCGNNVAIVVDEAQNLSFAVLEQIRMLSNLETEKEKLLQIVLVGQPELRRKLAAPRVRQLSQRITVRYHLTALGRDDVRNYIYYRLKVAGSRGDIVFTRAALDEIYYLSGGVPRLINGLCDRALMVGYVKGSRRITRSMVCQAATEATGRRGTDMRLSTFVSTRFSMPRVAMALLWAIPFAAVAALGALGSARGRAARLEDPQTIARATRAAQEDALASRRAAVTAPVDTARLVTPVEAVTPAEPTEPSQPIAESGSSIARVIREGGGSALGAPTGELHSTKPLRTGYAKPDIDFTPPPKNYTPATVASASYSSIVEPVVQLLLHWQVETSDAAQIRRDWLGRSQVNLTQIGEACRMGVARLPCSFDEMLAYDLPAVITVKAARTPVTRTPSAGAESKPHYIVLLAIKGDTATVYVRGKQVIIPLATVRECYDGMAVFFTSDAFVNKVKLDEDAGLSLEVRKLQDYLKTLGYFAGSPTGWYTPDTKSAVQRFQAEHGIGPTGVADAQTKLRLYTLVPPEAIPRLTK
jgi:putative secretion ATPase (PEP-CTERM system associated)